MQRAVIIAFALAIVAASTSCSNGRHASSVLPASGAGAKQPQFVPPPISAPAPPRPRSLKAPPPAPTSTSRSVRDATNAPPFFAKQQLVPNSTVYWLQFDNGQYFGYYSFLGGTWIYHFDLGYLNYTDANDGQGGIYFFDQATQHWWFTSPSQFPYLYDFTLSAWLWYDPDSNRTGHYTTNPRWFYEFFAGGGGQWIKMPDPIPHVPNWAYACSVAGSCVGTGTGHNLGIPDVWMASNFDWNEVGGPDDSTAANLKNTGQAKHILPYTDPNLGPYCAKPRGIDSTWTDIPENGANCQGPFAHYLHAANGSYAHAYLHRDNGSRLIDAENNQGPTYFDGALREPFYIGDPDVQSTYNYYTSRNPAWTEVFEDDAGSAYNCITDYSRCDAGRPFGSALYGAACTPQGQPWSYWCWKYHNTAVEWNNASSPQEAYLTDAINLSASSAHPVIGNNGAWTNSYDLRWAQSANVKGVLVEGAWPMTDQIRWTRNANAILYYHGLPKLVVELTPQPDVYSNDWLLSVVASHWIVYDPQYSVEALIVVNPSPTMNGVQNDTTFPEETVVPTGPLTTGSSLSAFVAPGQTNVYVREYATCFQASAAIGRCAAIVNMGSGPVNYPGLTTQSYGRVLVHNPSATWANGGTAQWSTTVPAQIQPYSGIIVSQ